MAWEDLKRIGKRRKKKDLPEGLWTLCKGCKNTVYKATVEANSHICPECGFHFPLTPAARIELHFDKGSFIEDDPEMDSADPLNFKGVKTYKETVEKEQKKTGMRTACVTGRAAIKGKRVSFSITDSRFIMGSMGSVVGEKITRTFERGMKERLPVITVTASGGGARMHEGMLSLMQMAKTSAAVAEFQKTGLPYISILTYPTMGGVMASFASLGDILIAEPGALIGFTGPRIIKQTTNTELPKGFQSSEFMLDHGLIDMIVRRDQLRDKLYDLINYLT